MVFIGIFRLFLINCSYTPRTGFHYLKKVSPRHFLISKNGRRGSFGVKTGRGPSKDLTG